MGAAGVPHAVTAAVQGQPPVFEVRAVTKTFDGFVANASMSFDVLQGSLTCLLGPNGAGKTTLVRQLLGLLPPTSGTISIGGADVVANPWVATKLCAYLPQLPYPVKEVRVREAVILSGIMRGLPQREATTAADAELAAWGLAGKRDRQVGKLSGGERRLLGIACTLIGDRKIIVLDEPTNELDPTMRSNVWSRVEALRREGRTILLITHNVHEVEDFVSQVLIISAGRLQANGSLAELRAATGSGQCVVRAGCNPDIQPQRYAEFGTVISSDNAVEVQTDSVNIRPLLRRMSRDQSVQLQQLVIGQQRLQEIYQHFVGAGAEYGVAQAGPSSDSR